MPLDPTRRPVLLPLRVNERRSLPQGRLGIEDRLEPVVLDLDQPARLFGDLRRQGGDGGENLALETNGVADEERPVADEVAVANVGHVVLCQHRDHSRKPPRSQDVEPHDPRVRQRRQDELPVGKARKRQVGEVPRGASRLLESVLARDPGADDLVQASTIERPNLARRLLRVGTWTSASTSSRSRSSRTS